MRVTKLLPVALIALALSATVACQIEASSPDKDRPARTQAGEPAGTGTGAGGSSDSAPAPADETLSIDGSTGTTQPSDCAGRDVVVDGQGLVAELTGTCGRLTVKGTGNQVTAEKVAAIVLDGTGHIVKWGSAADSGEPAVTDSGTGNIVTRT